MSRDIFDDRFGFAGARRAFVTKQRPSAEPAVPAARRPADDLAALATPWAG
jgi:putative two-component system hydrogenase maturation factor HypX/HoxX